MCDDVWMNLLVDLVDIDRVRFFVWAAYGCLQQEILHTLRTCAGLPYPFLNLLLWRRERGFSIMHTEELMLLD